MSRLMPTARELCMLVACLAIAGAFHITQSTNIVHYATLASPKASLRMGRLDPHGLITMRFAIRGRVATWSFAFRCNFKNTHPRGHEESSYVTTAAVFNGDFFNAEDIYTANVGAEPAQTMSTVPSGLREFLAVDAAQ